MQICHHSGKIIYRTRKKALKAAAWYKARAIKRQENNTANNAYQCGNCGYWHLSKQKERKK